MVEAILKERNRTLTGDTHPERGYFFRSDHFSFAKLGVPAISLSEPKQFTGPNAAELLKKQEAYNDKDYHQPSDQYDPSWDFTGGVERHARARAARLAHRRSRPEMPKYNAGDQFARSRRRTITNTNCEEHGRFVTLDEITAARERIRVDGACTRRCSKCRGPPQALKHLKPSRPQAAVSEVRKPSADGRVQDPRRVQHDRAAAEGATSSAA